MRCLTAGLLTLALAAPALAVKTSFWVHQAESDFRRGTFDKVVATNHGDLKLSRAITLLLEQDPRVSAVYALAEMPDGTIYAGTGPQGVLLKIDEGNVTTALTVPETTSIFSLLVDKDGQLLIGTGGQTGKVLRLEGDDRQPTVVFQSDGAQYIWAIQQTPDGNIYAATGPQGRLYEIRPSGRTRVLLDISENNLLSLASDGADMLYVGTDPNGRVYRINRTSGETFVMYDAAESEISALLLDEDGNLYAATGRPTEAPAATAGPAAPHGIGRPEATGGGVPIPAEPPADPTPPPLPDPNPAEPDPIPHASADQPERPRLGSPPVDLDDAPDAPDGGAPDGEAPDGGSPDGDAPEPGDPAPDGPGAGDPDSPSDAEPTPEQVRQAIRRALTGGRPPTADAPAGQQRPTGNAIYRIDPDGFVSEIFREQAVIFSMIERDGVLIVGTGGEGLIYEVNPAAEETLVLAKVDPNQVMAMLPARSGQIYLGMANAGAVAAMTAGFADSGTYTSPVLDASQISRFGRLQLHGQLPADTELQIATRSGNVREPGDSGWSEWSEPVAATRFVQVDAPSARFLQYRLIFRTGTLEHSPVVDEVRVAYQLPNLPPQVRSLRLASATAMASPPRSGSASAQRPDRAAAEAQQPRGTGIQTVSWEASDPNDDDLEYSLYYRIGQTGPWILLKDRLVENQFEWDTRSVADGRYQIRVVVSDALANPRGMGKTASRVSNPIMVDNTPPVIGDLAWEVQGQNVQIDLKVVDRTSTVASVQYAVNSADHWQAVLPVDTIFDSPEEAVRVVVPRLRPGTHQITVRATDARGNQAFENIIVQVN
jgi:hypothetical protein